MTESIGNPSMRPLTGPLRGNAGHGQPETKTPAPGASSNAVNRDRMEGASGIARLMQQYAEPAGTLQDLEAQARILLVGLLPQDQREAGQMLDTMLSQAPEAGESLEAFRTRLQTMMEKFKQFVNAKQHDQEIRQSSSDASWYLFYQSLERYLTNLQTLSKVEGQIQDRKEENQRSVSKFAERLLGAAASQPPDQRLSLLSVSLNPKP